MPESFNGEGNPAKVGPASYAKMAAEKLRQVCGHMFYPTFQDQARDAIFEAVMYGVNLYPPPFPPDSDRIRDQNREIVRLEAMVELAGSIMAEKDNQIAQFKQATGDLPLYEVRNRLSDQAFKEMQSTINRLSHKISELNEGRDSRIDQLEGLLQRQRDRIAALESNPLNEEARFNIERQYEREMTNVTHLTGKIFNQEMEIDRLGLKATRLDSQLAVMTAERDRIRREYADYQKRNPDIEEVVKAAAEKIAAQPWRGYEELKGSSLNTATDNYLRDPYKADAE